MEKMILAEMPIASSCDAGTLDFEAIVNVHGRFVLNVAYSVLRNTEDAEEIAQDTFFRAFRSGSLDTVIHMRAWLGRIAWRLALNRRRQHSRLQEKEGPEELLRTWPARETGAEDQLIRQEREILLERLLQSLPHDLRETFTLLAVEGMTSGDAAEILGIAESLVRDRLFRSRKLIKEKLAVLMEKSHGR